MVMLKHFQLWLLAGFALTVFVRAQDQTGFISLDCGLPQNSSYNERTTNLYYISDATFIDTGISKTILPQFQTNDKQQLWQVRSFPEGVRNCYHIRIKGGVRYLIRGTFMYGNYDAGNNLPEFELHLGPNMWDSVKLKDASTVMYKEIIHVPSLNYIHFCLVNTGSGTPFISTLELRPLPNDTYESESGSLALYARIDTGTITNQTFRYKDDIFDRIWRPYTSNDQWTPLSTSLTVKSSQNPYEPPSGVMSTAATPTNVNASLDFYLNVPADNASGYYVYMHFADVEKLHGKQYRAFNINVNGEFWYGPVVPYYLYTNIIYSTSPITGGKYQFSLQKTENSTLPPIINAFEAYKVLQLTQSPTEQGDVDAVVSVKLMYGVTRNWQGDPCAPKAYVWDGLQCSYDGYNSPRIISLNLSSSGLTGEIAPYISNLTMIQSLDLSNNSLTGPVPDFLSQLSSLRVLHLEKNNLNGTVPVQLIEKSNNGSLSLRYVFSITNSDIVILDFKEES
ncbi:hypothetical protein SLA2020_447510 [Shorea laevis]